MPFQLLLEISMRSACMSAPTFIENLEQTNDAVFQHCEGAEDQHQSGNTGFGGQVAFMDDYLQKISELLDREASKGGKMFITWGHQLCW